jgi:oligopeptide transport system ATP-binding protein
MDGNGILLEAKEIKKYFPLSSTFFLQSKQQVKAVDGVNLFLRRGETLGLVGESGCGKSTLGRLILRLEEPTSGEILFEGKNILQMRKKELRMLRRKMQIIFQDPYSSLHPLKTLHAIIEEPFIIHKISGKKDREERVIQLMDLVGLRPEHYNRYPHEFSGGQRQRICIARALALHPELVVCDEPVSSLDVSIQSQIINLLRDLQEKLNLTYLFISHNLNVLGHISDRVAVMYLGRVVELSPSVELYESPYHPYSEALLSSSPIPDPNFGRRRIILEGEIPSPLNPPQGCHFNTRCRHAISICRRDPPPPWEEFSHGHWARCWRVREIRKL